LAISHHAPNLTRNDLPHVNNNDVLPTDAQLLSCELCLKAIPLSESDISEAEDYVAYFCGLECYDIWRNQKTT